MVYQSKRFLIEMFKIRYSLRKLKTELETKDGLSKDYNHQEGRFIVNGLLHFRSSVLNRIFKPRRTEIDEQVQRLCNKARFENYVAAYNALRCQVEIEYDCFMNNILYNKILSKFCERTHSQYGIVAMTRAAMVIVNKEIWKVFLEAWSNILKRVDGNQKQKETEQDTALKEKQLSAAIQIKGLVNAEFIETWNSIPKEVQLALTQQKAKGGNAFAVTNSAKKGGNAFAVTNSAKKVKGNQFQSMKGGSKEDSFNRDKTSAKARQNVSREFSQTVKPTEIHNEPDVTRQWSNDIPIQRKSGMTTQRKAETPNYQNQQQRKKQPFQFFKKYQHPNQSTRPASHLKVREIIMLWVLCL